MQPIPKWALWLGGALAWVAGVAFALFAFAAPSQAEIAFAPERAALVCPGAAREALAGHGNAVRVPARSAAALGGCRIEIEFSVADAELAARAAASGYVELMGLHLARASFPERLPVGRAGLVLTERPGGLTLSLAAETLFGGERRYGAALILAWRTAEEGDARAYLSPTLLIERADSLRAKRTGN